ncbi:MAG: sensor histidine kinase [Euryarchaeota archaeon]|nr:sensor histidine kinase [Euryarchaeota archaeon]
MVRSLQNGIESQQPVSGVLVMSHKKFTTFAVAALLIVVVAWFGQVTNQEVGGVVQQQFTQQQLLLTRQAAVGIEGFLEERTVLIEVLADEIADESLENMTAYFRTVYSRSKGISSIGFANSEGVIVTGYPVEDVAIGLDLYATKKNVSFDRARDTGETYTTNPMLLVQGGIGSHIGVPVYSDNEFKGVVFATIDISTLSERYLADVIPEGHGHVYMITTIGRSLYDSAHKEMIGKKYIGSFCTNNSSYAEILSEQMQETEGTGYYFDESSGEWRIIAYTPIVWHNHIWSVATSVPASEVGVLVHSVYRKQILFITIVIAIILAGGGSIVLIFSRWNRELENEVEKTTEDLKKSNTELESANTKLKELDQLKSEFVSIASHELKTPLTAIKLSMDVLRSLSGSEKDIRTKDELLEIVDRNIERQSRLVTDLLDISRIETGTLKFNLESVDLYDIIRESVRSMRDIAERKGISIHTGPEGETLAITGDRDRLVQVFVNLIGNALKFTEKGEIRIQVHMVEGHPEIRVSDTGIGIPPEELDRIFDKFHQVDSGLTREAGGTGLGLAICRGIIEGHGGSIRAESEVGRGSVFVIVL